MNLHRTCLRLWGSKVPSGVYSPWVTDALATEGQRRVLAAIVISADKKQPMNYAVELLGEVFPRQAEEAARGAVDASRREYEPPPAPRHQDPVRVGRLLDDAFGDDWREMKKLRPKKND